MSLRPLAHSVPDFEDYVDTDREHVLTAWNSFKSRRTSPSIRPDSVAKRIGSGWDNGSEPASRGVIPATPVSLSEARTDRIFGCVPYSYARTSRTLSRQALRAGSMLAMIERTTTRTSQSPIPSAEKLNTSGIWSSADPIA